MASLGTSPIKNISEILPDEPIPAPFDDEIHFNNTVREYIVSLVKISFNLLSQNYQKCCFTSFL